MCRLNSVGNFCVLALSFLMMFPVSGSCGVIGPTLMGPPPPTFKVLIPVLGSGNHWVPGRVEFEFNKTELDNVAQPGMGVGGDRSKVFVDIPPPPPRLNSRQLAEYLAIELNKQFVPGALRASAAEDLLGGGGAWQVTFGNDGGLQVTTAHIKGMFNPGIHGQPDKYGSYTNRFPFPPAMPPTVKLNQIPEPTSIAIFGVLGLSLTAMRRRKRQNRTSHLATDK